VELAWLIDVSLMSSPLSDSGPSVKDERGGSGVSDDAIAFLA
jgi:hypothetical protein